jgi:uncharacterized protein (DUF305 family)
MIPRRTLALSLVALAACGGPAVQTETPRGPTPISDDAARLAAVADSTRNAYTPADVAFMVGMIHHHAQALTMSRMADDHGASDPLRILTARIINAQRDEIRLMQDWLRVRGEAVPDPPEMHGDEVAGGHDEAHDGAAGYGEGDDRPAGDGERDHGAGEGAGGHAAHMPGMLTAAQMAALDAAYGEEWDRLFLQHMIQHHEGALTMVEELFATQGAAQEDAVFKLASDIGADQASEITRMRAMLAEMLVAGDP